MKYLQADVEAIRITDDAMLLENDGIQMWIPRSAIEDEGGLTQDGHNGTVLIESWIADKKDLWDTWECKEIKT